MGRARMYTTLAEKQTAWRRNQKLQRLGPLAALFPYWGGKSVIAPLIWQRLGPVRHYLEPFAGSLAVLLARPHPPQVETINDRDGHLVNVYRALAQDPTTVAQWAEYPSSEVEVGARGDAVARARAGLTAQLFADHHFYDAELAGLWIYCQSTWIGSGVARKEGLRPRPHTTHTGDGIHAKRRRGTLQRLCHELQLRLRGVRMFCSDWAECLRDSTLLGSGAPIGVMLDPPYAHHLRDEALYTIEDNCAAAVREWAVSYGDNPKLRIALCGLPVEHVMPDTWTKVTWQARGGFSNTKHTGRGSGETRQEVVWFSPHCLPAAPVQGTLFAAAD